MNKLLIYSANPFHNDETGYKILQEALSFKDWNGLITEASAHGMTPLLHYHLSKYASIAMPESFKVKLHAQFLSHSQRNMTYLAVLQEILCLYRENDIEVLVMKGGALCRILYPYPALRPMRDVDLLVKPSDLVRAYLLLRELGFPVNIPELKTDHHMPPALKMQGGMTVSVEIHHQALSILTPKLKKNSNLMRWDQLKRPLQPFLIGKEHAFTMGYEDMLRHICSHLAIHPLRLIYVADVIGFAERFIEEIDWDYLKIRHPLVLCTLSNLGWLTPLSDNLKTIIGSNRKIAPHGVGIDYQGWPDTGIRPVWKKPKELKQLFRNTFCTTEWGLRLKYGISDSQTVAFCKFITHPLHLLKLAAWRFFWQRLHRVD